MSKLIIVMYHYVRDLLNSRYPGIKGLDYSLFKQQIEFFSQKFSVVTMEQVLEYKSELGGGIACRKMHFFLPLMTAILTIIRMYFLS